MSTKLLRICAVLVIGFGLTGGYAWANDQVADEHGDEYEVTFNVDMSEAEDFDPDVYSVYVTGSMTGWAEPGENPDFVLAPHDDDADIYTITINVEAGVHQYKYFLIEDEPNWDAGEWDGDPNREVRVSGDMEVNDVWGDTPFIVTFNVNLAGVVDFDSEVHDIFITGSMAGWAEPGSDPNFVMEAHEDDADIYTITLILSGDEYEYKYFMIEDEPDWDAGEWDGDPNRIVNVTEDMVVQDTWGVEPEPTSADDIAVDHPASIELHQNYPNPFNPTTQIRYNLDQSSQVTLEVYNALGQRVQTLVNQEHQSAGQHTYTFDGSNLSSGAYMYRLTAGQHIQTRVMTLIK